MPRTPDRRPGVSDEEGVDFEDTSVATVAGQLRYDGTRFSMFDSAGEYDPRSGSGLSEVQHKALNDLIHFIGEGPAEGFVSGAFKEYDDPVFTMRATWWTSPLKTAKIVELTLTGTWYAPTTEVWTMYDDAGALIITVTDTIVYSGAHEINRTREWLAPRPLPTGTLTAAYTTNIIGDPVSAWIDDSSNGYNLAQGTVLNRPDAGLLQGIAAPDFDEPDPNYMDSSPQTLIDFLNAGGEWHVFIVFNLDTYVSGTGTNYWELPALVSGTEGFFGIGVDTDPGVVFGWNDGVDRQVSDAGPAPGSFNNGVNHVVHCSYDGAASISLRVDDRAEVSAASGDYSKAGADALRLGAQWAGNAGTNGRSHYFFYGAMTAQEEADAYSYMSAKYGVSTP